MSVPQVRKWFRKWMVYERPDWRIDFLRQPGGSCNVSRRPTVSLIGLEDRITPAPIQFFYVPLPEDPMRDVLDAVTTAAASNDMTSFLTIAATEDGTVIHYDHWEDGYETNLGVPLQPTTQVWGDANPANGAPPNLPGDVIDAGFIVRLRNDVPANPRVSPNTPPAVRFDGSDRFGANKTVSFSRAQFPVTPGSVVASAVEVRDTRFYGTQYVAPVGTNTPNSGAAGAQMFELTTFFVMAAQDNTLVQIDRDNDGVFEQTTTLNQGQNVQSATTVLQGGRVVASKPVQVHLVTGDLDSGQASRSYTLFPTEQLADDYFTPVGLVRNNVPNPPPNVPPSAPVHLFVFNPNPGPITVNYETRTTSGTVAANLAPGATARFVVPEDTGTRLFTAGDEPFAAVGANDAANTVWDWGFTLQPVSSLSQIALVALGVGNSYNPPNVTPPASPPPPPAGNFSPVWVTPLAATTVYVDYDGDPTTGPFVEPVTGTRYDQAVPLARLQSARVRDNSGDFDNSGMRLFTADGTLISTAWGEDASTAPTGTPGFDAGTVVPALPVPEFYKFTEFAPNGGDANGDGFFNSGDRVRYTLRIRHIGTTPISNAVVTDALPAEVTYVPNSTAVTPAALGPILDDTAGTAFPLDDSGFTVTNLNPGETVVVTFEATINAGLPAGTTQVTNRGQLAFQIFRLPAVSTVDLTGAVGDRVWFDADGDGAQDAGEPGIVGATVTLTWAGPDGSLATAGDNRTFTATTGANGAYTVADLPEGQFAAAVTGLPAGLTVQTAGVPTFTLGAGQVRTDVDFGYRGTGSVGDRVWYDVNGNQVQDAGEPGIVGATVTLTWAGPDGNLGTPGDNYVAALTTGPNGAYSFGNLPAGQYAAVASNLPDGLTAATNTVAPFALGAGQQRADIDLGFRGTASVGDRVWYDVDGDGVQDAGEPGIVGATVTLVWPGQDGNPATAGDNVTFTATTAADGLYTIGNLPAGVFTAAVSGQPHGLTAATNAPSPVTLAAGQTRTDVDFGFRGTGAVGDRVWHDVDGDGVQGAGEPGIVGATVTLTWGGPDNNPTTPADNLVYTTTTGSDGAYTIPNLPAGQYAVAVANQPNGLTAATNTVPPFTLAVSQNRTDIDLGFRGTASVGDRVWYDVNGNGGQDAGEPGIVGATVALTWAGPDGNLGTPADNLVFTTTTTADGNYTIGNLPSGAFAVAATGLPSGLTAGTITVPPFPVSPGQARTDIDLGFRGTGAVGDRVWDDRNFNGVQDAGEPGLDGATVTLRWFGQNGTSGDGDDVVYPAVVTAGGGAYGFANLPAGTFHAMFTPPAGFVRTAAGQGGNPALDSDPDPATGLTAPFTLAAGATNSAIDAGMFRRADLQVTKTNGLSALTPGQTVTYTVVVSNAGPAAVTGAVVSDAFPADLSGVSWTATGSGGAAGFAAGSGPALTQTLDLPVGAAVTYTITATVRTSATGTLSNTARVDPPAGVADPTPNNNEATDADPLNPLADLMVTKAGPASGVPGQTVTYTITVANAGPSDARTVTVSDPLPAGSTFVSLTQTGGPTLTTATPAVGSGGTVTLSTPTLSAGATATFQLVVRVGTGVTGTLTNTATGTTTTPESTPANNEDSADTTLNPLADVVVTKSGPASAVPGRDVTYTVTVSNTGPSDAQTVAVSDPLPAGTTFVSVAQTGGPAFTPGTPAVGTNGTVTLTRPSLAPGASATFTLVVRVGSGVTGALSNTATGSTTTTDTDRGNDSGTATTPFAPEADLEVVKTDGSLTYTPGLGVTYSVVVTNLGPSDVTGATVSDVFPAALTGVSWTAAYTNGSGPVAGGGDLTAAVNLASGGSVTFTVSATVRSNATGNLVNTARADVPAGVTDPDPTNNSSTDTDTPDRRADLRVTKTDGVTVAVPGRTVTYTIVVSNAGPSDVTGAAFADAFPAALTGVTWSSAAAGGATGNTAAGSGPIGDVLNLPAGASVTYTATGSLDPSATGTLSNTAAVTTPGGVIDTDPDNNSATDTDDLTPTVDVSVSKTDGTTTAVPGTTTTYTIVVANAGPSTAAGVAVSDLFPASITTATWVSTPAGGGTGNTAAGSGPITDTLTLPPGASVTYTVTATVSPAAVGTLTNTATATVPAGTTDTDPTNNSATDTDTLTPRADLRVTKTDGSPTYTPGLTVTYTIVVTNAGPSDVTGARVQDALLGPQVSAANWTARDAGGAVFAGGTGDIDVLLSLARGTAVTFTVTAMTRPDATGTLVNTATVTPPAGTTDTDPDNNTATDRDEPDPLADLTVTKTGPAAAVPGRAVTYTITVTNAGPSDAQDVSVTDALPAGTTFTSLTQTGGAAFAATTPAVGSNGTVVLTVATLPSGASAAFTLVLGIASTATGTLSNTAAGTTATPDPDPTNDADTAGTALIPGAELRVTKTNGLTAVVPGTPVTYTIVVTNAGPSAVTGARVLDAFAAALTGVTWSAAYSAGSAGPAGGAGDIDAIVDLAAGGTATFTATGLVAAGATGTLSNTATVTPPAATPDPTPDDNTATDADPLTPVADLAVTKTNSTATYTPGRGVSYTLVVTNRGPSAVAGAAVTDALPPALTGATWTVAYAGGATGPAGGAGDVSAVVDLPVGATATFTVTATARPDAAGTLTNTATVAPPPGVTDPTPGNNTSAVATTPTPLADLRVTKTNGVTEARPGDTLAYTVTVTNAGPSDAAGVVLTDAVPPRTRFVTASGGGTLTGGAVVWDLGTVPAGATVTRTLTLVVDAAVPAGVAEVRNTAAVASATPDPTPADNTATDVDALAAAPDLVVTIGDGVAEARPGDTLTYTITVRNAGPQDATGVVLTHVPPEVSAVLAASGGTLTGGAVVWDLGTVPAGATVTRTVTVGVNAPLPAGVTSLTGTAAARDDGANGPDPTPANNAAADTDAVAAGSVVSGFAYVDRNSDGARQPGEPGIPGATVSLAGTDDLGNPVARTAVTDRDGAFRFAELRAGTYRLAAAQPFGLLDGRDAAGAQGGTVGDDAIDFALAAGAVAAGNLFGELVPSSVTGTVYLDLDGSGTAGPADAGLGGVAVTLAGTDDLGNPVARTAVTADDGSYYFGDLRPGTYGVVRGALAGLAAGATTPGTSGGTVADPATIGGIGLNQDTAATQYQFGAVTPADPSKRAFLGTAPAAGGALPLAARVAPLQGQALPETIPAMALAVPFVVTAPAADGPPVVRVVDAATGAERFRFTPFEPSFRGGVRVASGDLTGDGVPDLVVGAGSGGGPRVSAFDGRTGLPVAGPLGNFFAFEPTFTGGVTVAAADLNGDGFADLVVGAGAGGGPRVVVLSGRDGSVLRDFFAFDPASRVGANVAASDTDADGFADLVVGAGAGGGPRVVVLSGRDGSVLRDFFAFDPELRTGVDVAAGDVDGDGAADVVAGPMAAGGPNVRAFGGRSGGLAADFFAFDPATRGGVRVGAADLDGDGRADLIAASPGSGAVRLFPRVTDPASLTHFDAGLTVTGWNVAGG